LQTQVYEGLFLFDSNKFARDQASLPGEVEKIITDLDGEVVVSRFWEERRLAYPIQGQRKGTYWLVYFRSQTDAIAKIHRKCDLSAGILRQLILKIHPSLVEPILDHASGVDEVPEEEAATNGEGAVPGANESPKAVEPVGAAAE